MLRLRPPSRTTLSASAALALALAVAACSVGSGTGSATGSLDVANCWSGCYDLKPTFFGANPYLNTLQFQLEHGSASQSQSDGLAILVDDVAAIRANSLTRRLPVSLAPGVTPPGIPITPISHPPLVHASLYLQATCPTEDVALYAMESVGLGAAGSCSLTSFPLDGGVGDAGADASDTPFAACFPPQSPADAGADAAGDAAVDGAAAPLGSWIQFDHLFDGNPDESSAADRLIEGSFDFLLADPRQEDPSGTLPPPCIGHIAGHFRFYFQRGQPAQPFP